MQKIIPFALACTGMLASSSLFAAEPGFENFLLRSPSIFSPSQNYQVKHGRFEGYLGLVNGSDDPKGPGSDVKVTGTDLAASALYSPDGLFVLGIDVDYLQTRASGHDTTGTEISPSISFGLTPMISLGLGVHLVTGSADRATGGSDSTNFNYVSVGVTAHQDNWEATLAYNSENKDDKKPQNNTAQSWALHGRYRLNAPLALGVSFYQRDTSALSPAMASYKDEGGYGLHLESQFTDTFNMEFAFLASNNVGGTKGTDQTELVALGQFKVTPTLDLGAKLAYLTSSGDLADSSIFRPGIFLTSYF